MSKPTPAEVIRKAREHNISRSEAKRLIAASRRVELTRHDAAALHAHGLTLTQWNDLTDTGRAMLRQDITYAPHFYQDGRP